MFSKKEDWTEMSVMEWRYYFFNYSTIALQSCISFLIANK